MIKKLKNFINYNKEIFRDLLIMRKVQHNQKNIIKLCKPEVNALNIASKPLKRGNVERYYHFIFDLLLPLCAIIEATPSTTIFYIDDFGPLTKGLLNLFGERVRIAKASENNEKQMILGMNPNGLSILPFNFDMLRNAAFTNFNIDKSANPRKVLLIERGLPDPYYMTNTDAKQSGNLRRSIVNHRDLEALIRSVVSDEYAFENLVLEDLSLEEQIRCFSYADLVVGQHGAGLSNIIWMENGATVIEFGYQSRSHFEKISASKKHKFYRYKDYDEDNFAVDIEDFRSWLISNQSLVKFLR